jgi:hypothetical protein
MTTTEDEAPEGLGAILGDLGKAFTKFKDEHGELNQAHAHSRENEPLTVNEVVVRANAERTNEQVGSWVAVRPCDAPSGNKTFLGIYLGDLPVSPMVNHSTKSGTMFIDIRTNPAIWVPDQNRIVWGMGSWWGIIKKEEDLKQITDQDIENIWYVKALKELDTKAQA